MGWISCIHRVALEEWLNPPHHMINTFFSQTLLKLSKRAHHIVCCIIVFFDERIMRCPSYHISHNRANENTRTSCQGTRYSLTSTDKVVSFLYYQCMTTWKWGNSKTVTGLNYIAYWKSKAFLAHAEFSYQGVTSIKITAWSRPVNGPDSIQIQIVHIWTQIRIRQIRSR